MAEHKEKIIHTLKIPIILLHTRTHASKNVCFFYIAREAAEKRKKRKGMRKIGQVAAAEALTERTK